MNEHIEKMTLIIDQQTLNDLGIFNKRGKESIFSMFNKTFTAGGSALMEEWFSHPLASADLIKKRIRTLRYFVDHESSFPFEGVWFDQLNFYLEKTDERSKIDVQSNGLNRKLQAVIGADTTYTKIVDGIMACIHIIKSLYQLLDKGGKSLYHNEFHNIRQKLQGTQISSLSEFDLNAKRSHEEIARIDETLRFQERQILLDVLHDIYQLDVYITAARIARERGFCLPEIDTSGQEKLSYQGVFHPLLAQARGNDITLDKCQNIVFLTGANMAGKSTFMKSIGIALYLAHMGFPVPAASLVFSPRQALYTSINLPDNIHMGYSHFYAEVLRIKQVALRLEEGLKMFVIFDEMFRGTNVKDAYDATVEIVQHIYENPLCQFVLSTHIIEAGEALTVSCPNVNFVYLPTKLENDRPIYTYKLAKGITADRHGMLIVENEGIVQMLTQSAK